MLRSRNVSAPNKVLSTLLLRYPRFIHAEFMTHRTMSRNAASSRAIPVKKMIDDILADTAMPIHWGAAQKGMQADIECEEWVAWSTEYGREGYGTRESAWLKARDNAIQIAEGFERAGYHKQVINRLLEPFMHITVLVSATEWDNFLELRDHKDAEPHIQMLAREIRKCLEDKSTVRDLSPGEWHLPFISEEETCSVALNSSDLQKLSVARCASTSYKTTDGFDMTFERAEAIYDKLHTKPFHASPFEHVAQADERRDTWRGRTWDFPIEHGNFVGFRQLRRQLELQA
ncbi:hypothetical protein K538_07065 [Agrobacterium tumefaciens GW4]|nr:hypothetical protein K538_07065 [Agrobacterium tumefaciens GW4]